MARPRNTSGKLPPREVAPTKSASREASLRKRAASRHFTLEKEDGAWYAAIGGTRFGPMRTLDEVDEFLPKSK